MSREYDYDVRKLPPIQQRSVEELIDRNILQHKRSLQDLLSRFRNTVIVRALALNEGNVAQTAKMLQANPDNLAAWMKEAGL